MTNQEILDNAPEGATHYDQCGYYKFSISGWEFYNLGLTWIKTKVPPIEIRSLADVERISELEEEVKTLERKVKKAFWWSAEFTQVAYGGRIQAAWEYYKEQD